MKEMEKIYAARLSQDRTPGQNEVTQSFRELFEQHTEGMDPGQLKRHFDLQGCTSDKDAKAKLNQARSRNLSKFPSHIIEKARREAIFLFAGPHIKTMKWHQSQVNASNEPKASSRNCSDTLK